MSHCAEYNITLLQPS